MKPPENLLMIATGVWVDPAILPIATTAGTPSPDGPPRDVLPEDHPMWDHASGGDRNAPDRQWTMNDLAEAAITLDGIKGKKAGVYFDLLLDNPGKLFRSEDIIAAAPKTFASAFAIAGSLNGFRKHTERAGRVYPFYWWEGDGHGVPTRYAIRPSVAAVFNSARRRATTETNDGGR